MYLSQHPYRVLPRLSLILDLFQGRRRPDRFSEDIGGNVFLRINPAPEYPRKLERVSYGKPRAFKAGPCSAVQVPTRSQLSAFASFLDAS